jgi:hypothetical protein
MEAKIITEFRLFFNEDPRLVEIEINNYLERLFCEKKVVKREVCLDAQTDTIQISLCLEKSHSDYIEKVKIFFFKYFKEPDMEEVQMFVDKNHALDVISAFKVEIEGQYVVVVAVFY